MTLKSLMANLAMLQKTFSIHVSTRTFASPCHFFLCKVQNSRSKIGKFTINRKLLCTYKTLEAFSLKKQTKKKKCRNILRSWWRFQWLITNFFHFFLRNYDFCFLVFRTSFFVDHFLRFGTFSCRTFLFVWATKVYSCYYLLFIKRGQFLSRNAYFLSGWVQIKIKLCGHGQKQ